MTAEWDWLEWTLAVGLSLVFGTVAAVAVALMLWLAGGPFVVAAAFGFVAGDCFSYIRSKHGKGSAS
jgi:hypothetical protein